MAVCNPLSTTTTEKQREQAATRRASAARRRATAYRWFAFVPQEDTPDGAYGLKGKLLDALEAEGLSLGHIAKAYTCQHERIIIGDTKGRRLQEGRLKDKLAKYNLNPIGFHCHRSTFQNHLVNVWTTEKKIQPCDFETTAKHVLHAFPSSHKCSICDICIAVYR
jgi:hypothetical protein